MGKCIDLTGQKFGKLLVLEKVGINKNRSATWLCECDCGNRIVVDGHLLRCGNTKSCGCLRNGKYHGMKGTRIYGIWKGMKNRCRPENGEYTKKGITICEEWMQFIPFYEWAMANGYADDLTIDRINNDGNYCPENCRWVTYSDQQNNRTCNHLITCNGETHTIAEWAKITGKKYKTLYSRIIRLHWDIERALNS